MNRRPPRSPLFPHTPLFRFYVYTNPPLAVAYEGITDGQDPPQTVADINHWQRLQIVNAREDRKSTRLNSSHDPISYAVFCLKNKIVQRLALVFCASSTPCRS